MNVFATILKFYTFSVRLCVGLYLFPSLYIAVDRLVVVLFPLRFREMSKSMRFLKIILVGFHVVFSITDGIAELLDFNSSILFISKSFLVFLNAFELFTIVVIYIVMVAVIISSSRKMVHALQRGNSQNR